MIDIESIVISNIKVGERHRGLDMGKVDTLAGAMSEIGLQNPIHVFWVDGDKDGQGEHILVAGLHRLRAAEKLGWQVIDAIKVNLSETEREIWEISENLHRAGLTKVEEAQHLKRYAELIKERLEHNRALFREFEDIGNRLRQDGIDAEEQMGLVHRGDEIQKEMDRAEDLSGKNCPTWTKRQHERWKKGPALILAEQLGVDKRTINRALRRADNIAPDVLESIKDTSAANKGVELDALASMRPEEQREAVRMVKHGDAKDFRQALKFSGSGPKLPREGVALKEAKARERVRDELRQKTLAIIQLNRFLEDLATLHDFRPEQIVEMIVSFRKGSMGIDDNLSPDSIGAVAQWLMEVEKELRLLPEGGEGARP